MKEHGETRRFRTLCVHGGESPDPTTHAASPNLVMSTTFIAEPDASFSVAGFEGGESFVYSPNSMGTLLMYERGNIRKDYNLKIISINDIFPTLLYYSGYQLSMDLQGEVMREIFTDEFKLNNPIEILSE